MKNYLVLLNSILYIFIKLCLAQNINFTNYQKAKNTFVLKNYKNRVRKECKLKIKINNYN